MKSIRFLVFVLAISTLVLSACGSAATPNAGGGKVEAMPVAFLGTVSSITGNQWVISGTTVTVDPSVVRDGPFNVGDQVKVEGVVNPDGSFSVSRVELPAPEDVSATPQVGDDHGNDADVNDDHGNDANVNDDHGNDANMNDDHGTDAGVNDDHGNDASVNNGTPSPSDNSTNDNHGGSNSGKDKGGKDNGGSGGGGKGSGGGGGDDGGNHN